MVSFGQASRCLISVADFAKPISILSIPPFFLLSPRRANKVVGPLMKVVTLGMTPRALAVSTALGMTGGIFPFPGQKKVHYARTTSFGKTTLNDLIRRLHSLPLCAGRGRTR